MICLCKKIAKAWMWIVVLFLCFISETSAQNAVDWQREGSISIYYAYGDIPIEGVSFELYYVAKSLDEDVYIQEDKLSPLCQGVTDADGMLTFPTGTESLYPGLYLLRATPKLQGTYIYDTEACLIKLPSIDCVTGNWLYDVSIQPKCNREEMQEEPIIENTDATEKPTLPQTGVLWWPVPICLLLGFVCFVLSHLLKGRKENA